MQKSIIALLICLAVGCLAQSPLQRCKAPPLLTGHFSLTSEKLNLMADATYTYNAREQSIHIAEIGTFGNRTFHFDGLLYYREHVMYLIDEQNRICIKHPLKGHFHLLEVPHSATLLGAVVLGSSSLPSEGLDVTTWIGELEEKAKYLITVTMSGCIPVIALYHTEETGWVTISFYDNVLGVENLENLYPPSFCQGVTLSEEPADFFSLFTKHR